MNARDELAGVVGEALGHVAGIYDTTDKEDRGIADAVLAAGYSKPRTITEVFVVNALPYLSVIRTVQGYAMEKLSDGWYRAGVDHAYTPNQQWLPATLLHEPEAAA